MPSPGNPLSFAQQRLWFLDQLSPGLAVYNVPQVLELDGPLDVETLTRALGEIVRRHEPLRTVFPSAEGRPRQEVLASQPCVLGVEDLSAWNGDEAEGRLEQRILDEIRRPFNLATGPVIRTSLVRMGLRRHVLIVVIHHISFDGWSLGVFFRELAALYQAFSTGLPSPLPELPIRYVDFARRQRELMTGQTFERQMAYWQERLKPPRPTLALPSDRLRPSVQTHRGWHDYTVIPETLFTAIAELSQRAGVTIFMTLLAAYATFLQRLSGQDDLLIGTPIANRTTQDIEPLIGFFANSLAFRMDLSGAPTFGSLLQHASRVAIGAYDNQDLPFERIVEALNPERTLSYAPILQTFLVLDNNPNSVGEGIAAAGLAMRRKHVTTGTSKFDLMASIRRAAGGRRVVVETSADLFDPATCGRMLRMLVRLLEGIVENPDRPIARLPMLADQDRRQVTREWNPPGVPDDRHSLVDLIEAQVERTPEADAVVCGEDTLSYAGLNGRANRLARALRLRGVASEDRVGICLERSADLVVAVLAVLKAGAAYVPLDPSSPPRRLMFMATAAGCRVIVTERQLQSVTARAALDLLVMDETPWNDPAAPADNLEPVARLENLAYVIYTSGSTGRPKGVAVEHHSVVNLVRWALATFSSHDLSGMLASTSIAFDLSVFEIFVPLCAGGTVILVESLLALPMAKAQGRVTFVNTVPSLMSELLRRDRLPPNVAVVALAGEPLAQSLVARVYEQSGGVRVHDLYGPTEATVYATCALRTPDGPATIGKPIRHTTAFVLDTDFEPVPVGVPGELYLGGAGVAREYFGRPDLTSERFLVDPMPGGHFGRLYRTGDQVRWRSDGSLEFLGRHDRQIKLHGLRIEPAEVEAALVEHPGIRDAAVRRDGVGDDARLVAVVVEERPTDDRDVYEHLDQRVPHYMRPSAIVRLPALPRLPSGKVDRDAVARLTGTSRSDNAGASEPPAGAAVISETKRAQLLSWAGHDAWYPRDRTVPELVAALAVECPDALAVVGEEGRLTYAQLDARANQFAHYLLSRIETGHPGLNGSADTPIGVCLERSIDTIVSLLAIMKAGRAYLPLDPANPPGRIAALAARGRIQHVCTRRALCQRMAGTDARLLVIDADTDLIAAQPTSDPGRITRPDALAYVLFTSGTTGEPKAVGIPHRAIVRLAYGVADLALGAGATTSQLAPLSFDAATFEIWGPLVRGGSVAVAPEQVVTSKALETFIAAHHVTVMWLTASLFNSVIDDRPQALAGLRFLLIGGEALSVPHVQRALAELPRTRIINGYGPTETTTFACTHVIRSDDVGGAASIPIGRPLANTRVYVLGPERQLIAPGEAGELWIGGDGVGLGYLNDAELTAARFRPDPFASDSRARMYGSGDRVRFLPDGALEFLGRFDDQMKVRGFRIEPGEIEAALTQHPRVSRAVVGACDLAVLGRSLVAFVVPAPVGTVDHADRPLFAELRDCLRQRLPDFMVPSQWVSLAAIPLMPNGKIDRRALAELASAAAAPLDQPILTARSQTEDAIADIWRRVLNIGAVGRDESFFDLGGHSLLATQLLSRIQMRFGVDMDLRVVFATPTIAGLAAEVERLSSSESTARRAIPRVSRAGSLPLSFAQQRLWFLHQWHGESGVYNVPMVFRLSGQLDVKALTRALNAIVDRHEPLRTVFPLESGGPVQHVLAHVALAPPITDLSPLPPDEAEAAMLAIAANEGRVTFDLAKGPLIRAAIVRLSAEAHVLLVTLHHIVADGWSLGVLFRELSRLYDGERTGQPAQLPPLPVQYADFAVWQRRHLRGGVLDGLVHYWQQKLSPLPPRLDMPLDHARPEETTARGERLSFRLSTAIASRLARFTSEENTTLFVTSLAIYLALLSRYSGQEDICVGIPVANRTRPELEPMIGCFVNTLAIRGELSGNPTFRELVQRTRETAIDAQVHQDLPFELLVEALRIERSANRSPLFQALFGFMEGVDTTLDLPGVAVSRLAAPFDFAKFELTLDLRPVADGLRGTLEYNADLFDRQTAERFAQDYSALMTAWLDHPDRRLAGIPVSGADAKRQTHDTASTRSDGAIEPLPIARRSEATVVERRLASIWQRVLDVEQVGTNENFFELGGNSLMAVRLFADVADAFGVRLPLSTLFRNGTIAAQAHLLSQTVAPDVWSPLVPIQPLGRRPPFFLVHGIGGEVLSFQALADHLGTEQPMYGLQADSRDEGSRVSSIESVAARYVEAMRTVQPDGPYRLGGYSSGGVIAFQMAQHLRADGQTVSLLLMLDSAAPKTNPEMLTPSVIWRLVRNVAYWPLDDEFLRSGWAAQRARVRGKLNSSRAARENGGIVNALDAGADVRDVLGLWKVPPHARGFLERYVRMMAAYHPQPYPGAVTVLRARTLKLAFRGAPDLGWRRLADGGVTTTIIPGAHDTILKEPRVRHLAAALSESLQRA